MKSKLVYYPEKILLAKCSTVNFPLDQNVLDCIKEIRYGITNIYGFFQNSAYGASANQFGFPYRLFFMSKFPRNEEYRNKIYDIIINPEILDTSTEFSYLWEGCISNKDTMLLVKRPKFVTIQYRNRQGQLKTEKLARIRSRIAQHEMDHLNGVDFTKIEYAESISLDKLKDDAVFGKWKDDQYEKGFLF